MTDGTQKKGLIGFLKTVGLVEETPDAVAPARNTPLPPAPPHAPHEDGRPAAAAPMARPRDADPEVLAKLEKRLQANCPAAYLTFTEQYEALRDVIADETVRFKAALKTSHATIDQLVASLDQLLGVMETARSEFNHTFEENKGKRVGEAEASLKATDDLIASNERQVKAIEETIASLRTKRAADAEAMHNEAARLDGIRNNFDAAHGQVAGRLEAQKSRIQAMPKV